MPKRQNTLFIIILKESLLCDSYLSTGRHKQLKKKKKLKTQPFWIPEISNKYYIFAGKKAPEEQV